MCSGFFFIFFLTEPFSSLYLIIALDLDVWYVWYSVRVSVRVSGE